MGAYAARRIVQSFGIIVGLTLVVFLATRVSGDPAALLLSVGATPEDIERFRHAMGLDQPAYLQYFRFMASALTGNFGTSFQYHLPTMGLVLERLPATLELTVSAMVFAVLVGLPAGIVAATRRGSALDVITSLLALAGQSVPVFWLGIVLLWIFGVWLGVLPTSGRGGLQNLVLPSIALGSYSAASVARLTRASMLDVLGRDFIRTARAKGLFERQVLVGHALKNAAIPIITIVGLQLGTLLGGAVVTELIFSWPGVGRLAVQAVLARDYPLVQASVFVVAVGFVLVNTLVDLSYHWLDPRIRLGGRR
ncbi:MAG: ABC transporter permease [Chloroflexia bacterium]|nr:ABC transporter permease [Chloroflexia bacterium]